MRRLLIVIASLLCLTGFAQADIQNFGANSNALGLGVGARATGMGGAFVALADDATAAYWNPAGLGQMELYLYNAGMQYVSLPNEAFSSYLSYGFQLPVIGSFALAWNNLSVGDIQLRDSSGQINKTATTAENIFYISYGRKSYDWIKGLLVGATIKLLHNNLSDATAIGHGLDLGVIWQPILYLDHTIGLNIQNMFQQVYWQTDSQQIDSTPVNIKFGLALKFFASEDVLYFHHLITTTDLDYSLNNEFVYRLGIEYWHIEQLGLRLGVNTYELTAGASYRPDYYEVDYAFHYDLSEMGNHQHRFSLLLRFK